MRLPDPPASNGHRFQFVEAKARLGAMYGFLVPGDRGQADAEIRRLLGNGGEVVELGGHRIGASTIDPTSIVVRHETVPRATGPEAGPARYAVDGAFVDGRKDT